MPSLRKRATEAQEGHGEMVMLALGFRSQVMLVVRDMSSIPGWGRSLGGGHGNPLQYSCLENPMDRGTSWAMVHRVTKSRP